MSDERNQVLFQTIRDNAVFKSVAGGTRTDPRIYKFGSFIKAEMSDTKPLYASYRIMGGIKLPGSQKINIGQLNDRTYSLEIFGKKDTQVEDICAEFEDNLFYEKKFLTESLVIGYTWATRGTLSFDEGRQLWLETMTAYFTKIIKLVS